YLCKNFPYGLADQKFSHIIPGCWISVYDYQMVSSEIINKRSCRIYGQRSSTDEQYFRLGNRPDRFLEHIRIQSFFIKDHIWFDDPSALFTSGHSLGTLYILNIIRFPAFHAMVSVNTSVKFQN